MGTVAVTGGSGHVGRFVVRALTDRGHDVVNVDRARADVGADRFVRADLTDAGETYGALAASTPDAVVHLGTASGPGSNPESAIYRSNATSTWHVLEAAAALDVTTVSVASSIHAMGSIAPEEPLTVDYLPVDEDHDLTPQEGYGLGKQTIETLCDGFARRPGGPETLSTLRLPAVDTTEQVRAKYPVHDGATDLPADDESRDILFAYVHGEDVGDLVADCVGADYRGHERFWVSAPDTRSAVPTPELLDRYYPGAEVRGDLRERDSLIDTSKAARLLGWAPRHSWRTIA